MVLPICNSTNMEQREAKYQEEIRNDAKHLETIQRCYLNDAKTTSRGKSLSTVPVII